MREPEESVGSDEYVFRREDYSAFTRLFEDPGNKIVLSLGGGSVPGLCGNVALMQIIDELGLGQHVDAIWGTSAGAIVAGSWASGMSPQRTYELIAGLNRSGAIDVRWFQLACAFMLRPFGAQLPDGLIHGKQFRKTIEAGLAVEDFADCRVPFRCIACEGTGPSRTVVFDDGPLLPAILASIAIPGILTPEGKRDYYDGGLVEKTPLLSPIAEHMRTNDGSRLVLICTHFGPSAHRGNVTGFIERFMTTMYALEDLAWKYQLAEARQFEGIDLLIIDPGIDDIRSFDFARVPRNCGQARATFHQKLRNANIALAFGMS